jgi:hypothetical protein
MTRNAGQLDLTGSISGTDSVTTNPYLANYSVSGISSSNFPNGGAFKFNRIGLFLGDGVNAASASLADSTVTTNVPEPASLAMMGVLFGGLLVSPRSLRAGGRHS